MNPQGSKAWLEERLGFCTASNFSDVLAKGQGISRKKYLNRLVAERLTGAPLDSYSNDNMLRGNLQEPFARLEYEARTGSIVEEVGFIKHANIMAGCSLDGSISHDGGVEIKSVIPIVQMETIERGGFPPAHAAQIFGGMWITGRMWCDFVSYSPTMPENLRLYVFRVDRDQKYIDQLHAEVSVFLTEVDAQEKKWREFKQKGDVK